MYSINGVPLQNPGMGWVLRASSRPLPGVVKRRASVPSGGDGVVPAAAEYDAVSVTLVVKTRRAGLRSLYALFGAPRLVLSYTDQPSLSAAVELASASPEGRGSAEEVVDATFIVSIPGAFWRTAEVTSTAQNLTAASVVAKILNADGGISAPVGDAIVRVKGQVTALQVTDSSGAWMTFPAVPAGQWLRFHADTGRAFLTTTDTWTGGTEVSGDVDFGGPRNRFEIVPFFPTPADPTVREGRLTVASTVRVGASIQVRARAAHLV